MAPTRVLYVNHVAFIGGAEESLLALLATLDRERVEPVLACPPGDLATRAREIDVEVLSLPVASFRRTHNPVTLSGYMLHWIAGTNQFRRIVRTAQPGVIHANSAMAQVYAGSVAQKANIPCVWHARDLRPLPFPAQAICKNADQIVAISQCVREFLVVNGFPRRRIQCIHNGIDVARWESRVTGRNVRGELNLTPEEHVILIAAQFVPWKRHEDAIRAMPQILERVPSARLLLAGSDLWGADPEVEGSLRALVKELSVEAEVVFLGQRDDVPDLMSIADVVLIPSDAEPFGRAAIEAMALARPVVGTRAGGLPEVVRDGETGLLVVPRFPGSIADACCRLIENPSLAASLGEAGRRRVEEQFDATRVARETEELYARMKAPSLRWMPA